VPGSPLGRLSAMGPLCALVARRPLRHRREKRTKTPLPFINYQGKGTIKTLLSVLVAAAFAATGFNDVAQAKEARFIRQSDLAVSGALAHTKVQFWTLQLALLQRKLRPFLHP
jgi:hypothetical protein